MNENENRKMDPWKVIMAAALLVLIIGVAFLQEQPVATQATVPVQPDAIGANSTGNVTNSTVQGVAVQIMGYYPALDLYVTLPTGTPGPMITPFELNVTAPGQAVVKVYTGTGLYSVQQFTGNTVIHDNTSYTGAVNITVQITTAKGVSVYRWLPDFMSPVTYISYEKAKEISITPGLSFEDVGALGATIILAAIAFFKIFYPGAKARVRRSWIKEGPKRHV